MQLRSFGSTDLVVSEIGLGCARIGGIFQAAPSTYLRLLATAFESGITFFDTADMYSQGESEKLLGQAFRKKRSKVIIASKVGYCLPGQRRLIARAKPLVRPLIRLLGIKRSRLPQGVQGDLRQDFSPAYLARAVEGSLRRLRTDYLDILQLHSPPSGIVTEGPVADTWIKTLDDLQRSGKVRYYGLACDTASIASAALWNQRISSLQLTVNLLDQSAAGSLIPHSKERGIGVIARECLANGLLIKAAEDVDLKTYCRSPDEEALRREQLERFRSDAKARGMALASLALDYVRKLDGVSVALLGARTGEQLTEVLRLASL